MKMFKIQDGEWMSF